MNPVDTEAEHQFSKAKQLLTDILQSEKIVKELEEEEANPDPRLVYGKAPTLWLLIVQRLLGGISLNEAVKCLLEEHMDLLPQGNRRVEEGTLSTNSSAYSKARQSIDLEVVKRFCNIVCNFLAHRAGPAFLGQRVFILDGTTITLPPTKELKEKFPPAQNQLGESVWPVAMLLVAHELTTGCAMVPQINAMYGPENSSEAKQATVAIASLPSASIVLADSGFGIFQVVWNCKKYRKNFLFRLTKQRFKMLQKQANLVEEDEGYRTYHLTWTPSDYERRTNPELPTDASVEVFMHQITLPNGEELLLVTDLQVDALSAGQLYQRRYDVEFDIRDLKVTMDTEHIHAKSYQTVMKELYGSIIAFNIVTQFRRQAAKLINIAPRKLSFTGVWLVFQYELLRPKFDSYQASQMAYQRALINASRELLPQRKGQRNYPRVAHPRRAKSTKFQKEQAKQKANEKKNSLQYLHHPPNDRKVDGIER